MIIDKAALKTLWQQAFGDTDAFITDFFRTGFSEKRCRYIVREDMPAAALYWFDCQWKGKKLAYLYAVATDKNFRGQGLCRTLINQTHQHLQAEGYTGTVLVPAAAGLFSMYEKMGYRGFCPMEQKTVFPEGQPACIKSINAEAYGQLRLSKLPADGVIQAKETLRFLATYAQFYTTGDALLCAAREEDTLYIQEFLGDSTDLPGIVAALGAKSAKVRLPGGKENFAMYYSFTDDNEMPSYLGIALD